MFSVNATQSYTNGIKFYYLKTHRFLNEGGGGFEDKRGERGIQSLIIS